MSKAWIAGICVLMAGCDKPMVAGCEEFIQSQLKAPSTYKRIKVSENDERTTYGDLLRFGMTDTDAYFAKVMKQPLPKDRMSKPQNMHTVLIDYEANNSFNTPLRDRALCAFAFSKDDSPDKLILSTYVHSAISRADRRALIEAGIRENDGKVDMDPAYPCCL